MDSIPPEAGAPDDFPTEEEFKELLKDPAYVAHLQSVMREMLNGRYGEMPPEMREAAERSLKAHAAQQTLQVFQSKMDELCKVISSPPGTYRGDERLVEARRLLDELTDLGLELPEPHRTNLLRNLVPIRAEVQAMK